MPSDSSSNPRATSLCERDEKLSHSERRGFHSQLAAPPSNGKQSKPYRYIVVRAQYIAPSRRALLSPYPILPPPRRFSSQAEPVTDITTTRFGRPRDFDNLSALETVVAGDGVLELNSGQLGVFEAAVGGVEEVEV